jgi:hypothetical protein
MSSNMKPNLEIDPLDRILAGDEELIPTSGFLGSVMDRVREEASAPPPIPFPWKRAIPGIALAAGVFGWGGVELVRSIGQWLGSITITEPHLSAAAMHTIEPAGLVTLALAVAWGSWLFSRRLVGRVELL